MLLIIGSPRSGTSWLAKIFDSHPDVLYRHEPDSVAWTDAIPLFCRADEIDRYLAAARDHLDRLRRTRKIKATGSLPVFEKSYHNPFERHVRKLWIYGLKGVQSAIPGARWLSDAWVPDLVDPARRPSITLVIKSIIALGRVNLLHRAAPEAKLIIIVRHPCGHLASVLRGISDSKFEHPVSAKLSARLAETGQARRRGLTVESFERMELVEQLAWRWVILNEKAMEEVGGLAGAKMLRYEDLCDDPEGVARQLFDFAELDWNDQTARFIGASVHDDDTGGYYRLFRNPKESAGKWRQQLDDALVRRIMGVVSETEPGRLFP